MTTTTCACQEWPLCRHGVDLNDVLPYTLNCADCGAHEEGERHVSAPEPITCQTCRDGGDA